RHHKQLAFADRQALDSRPQHRQSLLSRFFPQRLSAAELNPHILGDLADHCEAVETRPRRNPPLKLKIHRSTAVLNISASSLIILQVQRHSTIYKSLTSLND